MPPCLFLYASLSARGLEAGACARRHLPLGPLSALHRPAADCRVEAQGLWQRHAAAAARGSHRRAAEAPPRRPH